MGDVMPTIHDAVRSGDLNTVERLVYTERMDVNAVDIDGKSPIWVAAEYSEIAIADWLYKAGADINFNQADHVGMTPLMASLTDMDTFDYFVSRANINAIDMNSRSVHDYATYMENHDAITKIETYGGKSSLLHELGLQDRWREEQIALYTKEGQSEVDRTAVMRGEEQRIQRQRQETGKQDIIKSMLEYHQWTVHDERVQEPYRVQKQLADNQTRKNMMDRRRSTQALDHQAEQNRIAMNLLTFPGDPVPTPADWVPNRWKDFEYGPYAEIRLMPYNPAHYRGFLHDIARRDVEPEIRKEIDNAVIAHHEYALMVMRQWTHSRNSPHRPPWELASVGIY